MKALVFVSYLHRNDISTWIGLVPVSLMYVFDFIQMNKKFTSIRHSLVDIVLAYTTPGQISPRTIPWHETIFLRHLPLSRFLVKPLRVNNITMKSFSKICRSKSLLNCMSHNLYIKLRTQHKLYKKLVHNPYWRVVTVNYVLLRKWKWCS